MIRFDTIMDPSLLEDQDQSRSPPSMVTFKPRKRKNIRQKIEGLDDDEGDQTSEVLEEVREIQKFKKREVHGVNVVDLLTKKDTKASSESSKTILSGLTDAKAIVASELELGNTFSAETNLRDEDAEMSKFIEEELRKRKGVGSEAETGSKTKLASNPEDLVFNVLPEHLLNAGKSEKNEEMLSSQMLSGIPEIDLGIEERIRNIEATEEAKMKHLFNRRNQKPAASNLVPTNIAVNFQQNSRFNRTSEETPFLVSVKQTKPEPPKPAVTVVEEPVVVIGDEPRPKHFKEYQNSRDLRHPGKDKASDNYHFDRFRKQLRK